MARRIEAAKAAGKVSVAVLASRVLGLVREQVMAAVFGAGLYNDAWVVAFRIPNMLRDLFAEGALSSAFVPIFTRTLKNEGRQEAWLLANLVINGLLVLLGFLAVIFVLFSDVFVYLVSSGYAQNPEKFHVTSVMVKILSPFLALVAVASVVMGILNALDRYFLPALAPAFFNVALIAAGLFLAPLFQSYGTVAIYAIAVGAVVGGVLQVAVQLPLLYRRGFRHRIRVSFRHPGIRSILALIGPAAIGMGAVHINVLVNTQLASLLGDGPVSWLNYAFRLFFLPVGLVGVAVGVVNLREVSVYAAKEEWEQLRETVANSIKLISFLAMPSAIGLMILAGPIVQVIFERGLFGPLDTQKTALALIWYALGLFGYSCIKVYAPTFYAMNRPRVPVIISMVAVVTNISVNLILVFWLLPEGYRYAGLAVGTSVSVLLNSGLLALSFRRQLGSLKSYQLGSAQAKTLASALLMGVVVGGMKLAFQRLWPAPDGWMLLLETGVMVGGGVLTYLVCCHVFAVEEVTLLRDRFWRR